MSIRVVATWAFLFAPVLLTHCSGTDPAPSTAGQAGAATTGGSGGSGGNGALPAAGGAGSANLAGANNAAGSGGAVSASGGAGGGSGGTGGISNGGSGGMAGSNSGGGGAGTAGSAGAGGSSGGSGFAISSSQHVKGAVFADSITCAGEGVSPPLAWTAGPTGTKSYAITFFDQTLVSKGNANGYHWVIWDIPAATLALPAKLPSGATLTTPVMARQIAPANPFDNWPKDTFFGPCPNAVGNTNNTDTYAFTIYALPVDKLSGDLSSVKNVGTAIEAAKPLANAELSGTSSAKPN